MKLTGYVSYYKFKSIKKPTLFPVCFCFSSQIIPSETLIPIDEVKIKVEETSIDTDDEDLTVVSPNLKRPRPIVLEEDDEEGEKG
jgi:hypothetical protein